MQDEEHKLLLEAIHNLEIGMTKKFIDLRNDMTDLRTLILAVAAHSGMDAKTLNDRLQELRKQHGNRMSEFPFPDLSGLDSEPS